MSLEDDTPTGEIEAFLVENGLLPLAELTVAPRRLDVHLFRAPVARPRMSVFGRVTHRTMLLVRVEDEAGHHGWGEVWANFPLTGAEHRGRLLLDVVAPSLTAGRYRNPAAALDLLTTRLHGLALQAGEPGPIAQALAGVDAALWDLVARRAGLPLFRLLGGGPDVPVYASSLPPDEPVELALAASGRGHRAFKLRIGFGAAKDLANLAALRRALGDEATIMVDANQSLRPAEARAMIQAMAPHRPFWVEEPIAADSKLASWRDLAAPPSLPLAAGENLRGLDSFRAHLESGAFAFIQPDVGKWGGVSGALAIGHLAGRHGVTYCPHWLAGGIGLLTSLHLKASVGGAGGGFAEVDANPNPLREVVLGSSFPVREGGIQLTDAPGLGVDPGHAALAAFRQKLD